MHRNQAHTANKSLAHAYLPDAPRVPMIVGPTVQEGEGGGGERRGAGRDQKLSADAQRTFRPLV